VETFRIVRVSDEGSSSEFVARIMYGILRLREDAIRHRCPTPETAFLKLRDAFDGIYDPVLAAIRAVRKAAAEVEAAVAEHVRDVESGAIVDFQPRAFQITKGIDLTLQDLAGRVLMHGVVALRATQKVTAFSNLDIGAIFQKPANFERGMRKLQSTGHDALAAYLRAARSTWTEAFIHQRAAAEHEGWVLPSVNYELVAEGKVRAVIPSVCQLPVHVFARLSVRRLQAFVENVVVYSLTRDLIKPMILLEIPRADRRAEMPERFRYGLPDWGRPVGSHLR
jgi:hypothetical protein